MSSLRAKRLVRDTPKGHGGSNPEPGKRSRLLRRFAPRNDGTHDQHIDGQSVGVPAARGSIATSRRARTARGIFDSHLKQREDMRSRSRGTIGPSSAGEPPSELDEGAGKAGSLPPPWPACGKKCRRQVPQVRPRHPGLPCAMVLTAASRSPWCAGLVGHHRELDTLRHHHPLDTSIGVSGRRDLTVHASLFVRMIRSCCSKTHPSHPTANGP